MTLTTYFKGVGGYFCRTFPSGSVNFRLFEVLLSFETRPVVCRGNGVKCADVVLSFSKTDSRFTRACSYSRLEDRPSLIVREVRFALMSSWTLGWNGIDSSPNRDSDLKRFEFHGPVSFVEGSFRSFGGIESSSELSFVFKSA